MKFSLKKLFAAAALVCFVASCSSSKKMAVSPDSSVGTIADSGKRMEAIIGSQAQWETFTSSGKIRISGGKSLSSSMQIKMTRDKDINISLRPILGIEVAKLWFSGDSVVIVDKYDGIYIAERISELMGGIDLNVGILQNLLLGRVFNPSGKELKAKDMTYGVTEGILSIVPKETVLGHAINFMFDKDNQITQAQVLREDGSTTGFGAQYTSVAPCTLGGNVAKEVQTSISVGDTPYTLQFSYGNISWNQPVNNELVIPSNCQRIDAKKMFKAIENISK